MQGAVDECRNSTAIVRQEFFKATSKLDPYLSTCCT